MTRFGWKRLAYLAKSFESFKAKGCKHHPASRWICKHFQSCKTDIISNARNVVIFEKLSSIVEKTKELAKNLKISIIDHLQSFEIEFQWYFSDLKNEEDAFLQNLFSTSLAVANILDKVQNQFCNLGNDLSAHDTWHEMSFSWFLWAVHESHPHRSELAF